MWLHLFSILTLGSVQSLTIGYPYRTLLSYDSTRSLGKVTAPQGFLIYLDNSGIERIVSFNYAEPVYAIRRINFISHDTPIYKKFEKEGSSELNEAREAHFRAWSLQQYQVLKREIDFLRGEGKEPTIEMALKFLPLEKIALTSDYSTIADLPDIKRVREEHLNIWNKIVQTDEAQNKSGTKSSTENSKISSIEMEVKKIAHEDQIEQLKPLEMQQDNLRKDQAKSSTVQPYTDEKFVKDQLDISKALDEVKNIKPEARFANKIDNKSDVISTAQNIKISDPLILTPEAEEIISTTPKIITGNLEDFKQEFKKADKLIENLDEQAIKNNTTDAIKTHEAKPKFNAKKETLEINSESESKQGDQKSVQEQQSLLLDPTEVVKASEDVSNLEMEAKKLIYAPQKLHSDIEKLISVAPTTYVPQQVVDTAEVMRARDEHLKIVNEAIQKAKLAQLQEKQKKSAAKLLSIVSNGTKVESIVSTPKTKQNNA